MQPTSQKNKTATTSLFVCTLLHLLHSLQVQDKQEQNHSTSLSYLDSLLLGAQLGDVALQLKQLLRGLLANLLFLLKILEGLLQLLARFRRRRLRQPKEKKKRSSGTKIHTWKDIHTSAKEEERPLNRLKRTKHVMGRSCRDKIRSRPPQEGFSC